MSNKQELKVGFEFLQPIIDAGIEFHFKWNENFGGYYFAHDDEVLLSDGRLYNPSTICRDRRILQYENGEIEMDEGYDRLKLTQQHDRNIKIVDANRCDASIFDVQKYIELVTNKITACKKGDSK